jgi:hypothetical protein
MALTEGTLGTPEQPGWVGLLPESRSMWYGSP